MLQSMSDFQKHIGTGIIGTVGAFLTQSQLLVIIPPAQFQQLINALVTIIAGLLTGLMSKYLHKWFMYDSNQKVIEEQTKTICDLQNQLYQLSQQKPITNEAQTKQ